ncbi:cilia- and flagella-associated protein 45-like [Camellia sinensis]|uniref:cilia- and flagella-associated protein 45-like n=1 Tax=Camellia sinensis TaxID=4442 RepID=UPI00103609DA|nr:cilia- and flagella-associated protein 45-like [Camellia sinensis]
MSAPEGAADESGAKRAKVAPAEVEVPVAKDAPEVVGVTPTLDVVETAPTAQVGAELTEAAPRGREQTQKGLAPQEGGVRLATAIYHACAVAGRLEGEEGPARAGVDRLVKIMEEAALRSASGFNEADLLRGLYSAQMEVTTLAGALLRKAGATKLKAKEAKAQLAKLKKDSADWKTAHAELQGLEDERVKAEEEKGRLVRELEAEKVKAMAEMESLKKGVEEERATAAAERGALQRELDKERVKAASERAAYPDLGGGGRDLPCLEVVTVEGGSTETKPLVQASVEAEQRVEKRPADVEAGSEEDRADKRPRLEESDVIVPFVIQPKMKNTLIFSDASTVGRIADMGRRYHDAVEQIGCLEAEVEGQRGRVQIEGAHAEAELERARNAEDLRSVTEERANASDAAHKLAQEANSKLKAELEEIKAVKETTNLKASSTFDVGKKICL